MNAEVKRFFREAQMLSSLPSERWFVPGVIPAPSLEIHGENQGENREKLVKIANSLLVTANHKGGDYSQVYYKFEPVKGRRKDSKTRRMVSRAMVSVLVHER